MTSRSRTIITRVLVFVLLGAIVNVAVAWGCVVMQVHLPFESRFIPFGSGTEDGWLWTCHMSEEFCTGSHRVVVYYVKVHPIGPFSIELSPEVLRSVPPWAHAWLQRGITEVTTLPHAETMHAAGWPMLGTYRTASNPIQY